METVGAWITNYFRQGTPFWVEEFTVTKGRNRKMEEQTEVKSNIFNPVGLLHKKFF